MAVVFDFVASSITPSTNTCTFAHTMAGANRYLLVLVDSFFAAGDAIGVTYNGVAMTHLGSYSATEPRQSIWGLAAPALGANNVVVTFFGSPATIFCGSMSFTGVNQASPTGTFTSTIANSSAALSCVSPSTDANGIIAAIVGDFGGSVITPTTGVARASSAPSASQVTTQSGASATNSWTFSVADNSTACCILVKPFTQPDPTDDYHRRLAMDLASYTT